MAHKAKIVAIGYTGRWEVVATAARGTPSFLNISSNVLKATGLTKLGFVDVSTY